MGNWIGYQVIAGVGQGSGFQIPIIAIQNTLPQAEVSLGMSIMMFCRTLSGAVVFAIFDVFFSSGLTWLIPKDAPGINPQVIISAGVTSIRSAVSSKDLPGVLTAYAKSIDYVFYLSAALGACGVAFACGMDWKDIRTKNLDPGPEQAMVERTTVQPVQEQVKTVGISETSRC